MAYQYSVGVNKPLKTQYITTASSEITAEGPNKYEFTSGSIVFYTLGDDVPEDGDYIVIMQDQVNYLMKGSAFTSTYQVVA